MRRVLVAGVTAAGLLIWAAPAGAETAATATTAASNAKNCVGQAVSSAAQFFGGMGNVPTGAENYIDGVKALCSGV